MRNIKILIISFVAFSQYGCSILREYPRRPEITLKARASNSVEDGGERSVETTLELKGNNRDILSSYRSALEFSLEKLGLLKK